MTNQKRTNKLSNEFIGYHCIGVWFFNTFFFYIWQFFEIHNTFKVNCAIKYNIKKHKSSRGILNACEI